VIQEACLYVYNLHYILEKHFGINIAPVRSRGGSLITNIIWLNSIDSFSFPRDYDFGLFIVIIVAIVNLNYTEETR
jgi:hypothetical protein